MTHKKSTAPHMLRADKALLKAGFEKITNPVALFHARRSLGVPAECTLRCYRAKLKHFPGYAHIALMYPNERAICALAAYSISHDPILYGLRDMYVNKEIGHDTEKFIENFIDDYKHDNLETHHRFIGSRFKGNYIKPRVRAVYVWLRSKLR